MRDRRAIRNPETERRGADRVAVRCEVEFLCGGVLYVANAENLSVQGAFVATEVDVPHGLPVDVCLTLNDVADPVKIVGTVVRVARRRDERPGFAIEFGALDDATRIRLQQAVESS